MSFSHLARAALARKEKRGPFLRGSRVKPNRKPGSFRRAPREDLQLLLLARRHFGGRMG
jgi:hypothetical protein